jgi:hypothetical protein
VWQKLTMYRQMRRNKTNLEILSLREYLGSDLRSYEFSITKKEHLFVRVEVFGAVTMKNAVFWDVTSCGSLVIFLRNLLRLLVTANVVLS